MTENDNHRREKEELQKELRDLHGRLARLQENNVCDDRTSGKARLITYHRTLFKQD